MDTDNPNTNQKKSAVPPRVGIKYGGYGYGYLYKLGLYHGSGRVRKSLPVHDSASEYSALRRIPEQHVKNRFQGFFSFFEKMAVVI
jgi:hypothetical protein